MDTGGGRSACGQRSQMFDLVRVDHFRGFEAYWEVPADEPTAVNGNWVKGPGAEIFHVLEKALGRLPIVAENLGVITPEVEAIRAEFGFPGMAVLQFAFGADPQAPTFQPHNYPRNLAAYTGTHDNDTAMGWWRSQGGDSTRTAEDVRREKAKALAYLGVEDDAAAEINWLMIRTLMMSVADTVIFPMQDVLGPRERGAHEHAFDGARQLALEDQAGAGVAGSAKAEADGRAVRETVTAAGRAIQLTACRRVRRP